jgi:hypothetical protein
MSQPVGRAADAAMLDEIEAARDWSPLPATASAIEPPRQLKEIT